MADYEISADIKADSSGFEKGIKSAQKSMNGFSEKLKAFSKTVSGGVLTGNLYHDALNLVGKGIKAVANQIKTGLKDVEKYNKAQNILSQTIKVTGANAWTSAQQLNEMSDKLSQATNYSGDEITQLQTVLLGFKNIGPETFESTTEAILDMATVMGMDLTSATQTVAKALDDPIKGLGSLSRQGFAFSDSQKEILESMVAVGDMAGAQKVILDELNTTYGGASTAGVEMGKQLSNTFSDLRREVARNLVLDLDIKPFQENLNEAMSSWKKYLADMADAKEKSDKLIQAQEAESVGTATEEQKIILLEREQEQTQELLKYYQEMLKVETDPAIINQYTYAIRLLSVQEEQIKAQISQKQEQIEKEKQEIELIKKQAEERKKAEDERFAKDSKAQEIIDENTKAMEKELLVLEETATLNGEVADAKEKLEIYEKYYIDLITQDTSLVSKNNQVAKDRLKTINDLRESLGELVEVEEEQVEITEKHPDILIGGAVEVAKKQIEQQIKATEKWKNAISNVAEAFKKVSSAIKNIMSKVLSGVGKLFNFTLDGAIDNLLEWEDKVLTFIYETIPQLPKFFRTAVESFKVLFGQLIDWVKTGGLRDFADAFLSIFFESLKFIADNLGEVTAELIKIVIQLIKEVLKNLPQIIVSVLKQAPEIIKAIFEGIGELLKEAVKGIGSGFKAIGNWFTGLFKKKATGSNNVQSGLTLVGEQGPELVDFKGGERIYTAQNTRGIMNSAVAGGNSFNVTFNNLQDTSAYTMIQQLKTYNRQMAINGVL